MPRRSPNTAPISRICAIRSSCRMCRRFSAARASRSSRAFSRPTPKVRCGPFRRRPAARARFSHALIPRGQGRGRVANNLGAERTEALRMQLGLKDGDAVFFVAGEPQNFYKFAGAARTKVGEDLGLVQKDRYELCWIVDFPMYEWSEEEKKIDFSHNPFSMPNASVEEFLALDANDRDKILALKAIHYDIVCTGIELSSGAIRNHRPDVMKKAFAIAGYDESVLEQKFGGMLHALSLGAPPHGGIAPGIDRIVMLLCGEENLREVVLFPMNQRAEDLLMGAPSEVSPKQLRELHIRVVPPGPGREGA